MAGFSFAAEAALRRLFTILAGFAECPILINNAEEINSDASQLLSDGHGLILALGCKAVNAVCLDV